MSGQLTEDESPHVTLGAEQHWDPHILHGHGRHGKHSRPDPILPCACSATSTGLSLWILPHAKRRSSRARIYIADILCPSRLGCSAKLTCRARRGATALYQPALVGDCVLAWPISSVAIVCTCSSRRSPVGPITRCSSWVGSLLSPIAAPITPPRVRQPVDSAPPYAGASQPPDGPPVGPASPRWPAVSRP